MSYRWFVYDGQNVDWYKTEDEAVNAANESIDCYRDEEWPDEVENVVVGFVTHRSTRTNVVTREMLDEERCFNGRYYAGNCDYWCDYEVTRDLDDSTMAHLQHLPECATNATTWKTADGKPQCNCRLGDSPG